MGALTEVSSEPRTRAQQGLILGRLPQSEKEICGEKFRPVLVLGPQRSRKTTGFVIPSLLDWEGAAVVTSVRTDVLWATLDHRSKVGKVFIFEPTGRLLSGDAVVGWNPLLDCRDWDSALQISYYLSQAGELSLRDGGFWYGLSAQLLGPILYAAANGNRTMADVIRWVNTQEEYEIRAILASDEHELAMQTFDSIAQLEDRTRSSVYATLTTVLRVYSHAGVLASTTSAFQIADLFDGNANTLYLCAPAETQEELAPLFTALLRRIQREAYERQNLAREPISLLMLLDEAGHIAPLANLGTLAATAAGTNIQLVSVFHDMAQMTAIYGESRARSIANNHSAWLLLPGNRDPLTSQFIHDVVGDEGIVNFTRDGKTPPLRRLQPGSCICIYESEPAELLKMRSSSHDECFSGLIKPHDPAIAHPYAAGVETPREAAKPARRTRISVNT